MATGTDNVNTSFNEEVGAKENFNWRYGGHHIAILVKEFFCGRTMPRRGHDTFTSVAETLVANFGDRDNINENILKSTKELLRQQRMLEDTHARRRLERWATRVISWYLIIVLILVVADSTISALFDIDGGFITGSIMAAILTTTTINIIGLGLIVLRGHFPKSNTDEDTKKQ